MGEKATKDIEKEQGTPDFAKRWQRLFYTFCGFRGEKEGEKLRRPRKKHRAKAAQHGMLHRLVSAPTPL